MSPSPALNRLRPPGFLEGLGFCCLAFFIFGIFSAAIDFIPGVSPFRPSLMAALFGIVIMAISGRDDVFKHRISLTLIALTLWFVVCVPFAVWPGGAVHTILNQWLIALGGGILTGGLIFSSQQFRRIAHLIGYCAVILSTVALAKNDRNIEGRIVVTESRYGNPNDLAVVLLVALPFLGFMALRKGNGIRRPLAIAGFIPAVLVIMNTGSRAALIGASIALLAVFVNVGLVQRLKLLVVVSIVLGMLMIVMPGYIEDRFLTTFGREPVVLDNLTKSSLDSTESRRRLLMDSITITCQHPVFGVGPGNFMAAQNSLAIGRGELTSDWHVSHNTYTQVSSESGLPGLALFLLALAFALRSTSRILRLAVSADSVEWEDIKMMAFALRVSTVAFLACAFFASMAYLPILTVLFGLAISLESCANNLLGVFQSTSISEARTLSIPCTRRRYGYLPERG